MKGREYEDVAEKDLTVQPDDGNLPDSFVKFMIEKRLERDPGFLDKWLAGLECESGTELAGNGISHELGPFQAERDETAGG